MIGWHRETRRIAVSSERRASLRETVGSFCRKRFTPTRVGTTDPLYPASASPAGMDGCSTPALEHRTAWAGCPWFQAIGMQYPRRELRCR